MEVDLNTLANTQLNKLNCWLIVNKLHLNIEKTCLSVLSKSAIDKEMNIRVGDERIHRVPSCRCISIIIDEKLTWTMHVESVSNKLVRFIGIFYKLRTS